MCEQRPLKFDVHDVRMENLTRRLKSNLIRLFGTVHEEAIQKALEGLQEEIKEQMQDYQDDVFATYVEDLTKKLVSAEKKLAYEKEYVKDLEVKLELVNKRCRGLGEENYQLKIESKINTNEHLRKKFDQAKATLAKTT